MIDSHQHFWRLDRGDYHWMSPDLAPLYRDHGPEDLAPILARHGIGRTILVQAAATVAETAFMLDVAGRAPFVAGVVGWVEFTDPDAPTTIARLAANPLLVGLRPMVQDIADDDWLVRPDLAPAFRAVREHGLVFDALVFPRHLSRLLVVLDRHPDLPVVVDHGAKPGIAGRRLDPWRADMAAVAARPRTTCKLSGLVTEAGPDWTVESLRPTSTISSRCSDRSACSGAATGRS
jgi:L-fuconolactonase